MEWVDFFGFWAIVSLEKLELTLKLDDRSEETIQICFKKMNLKSVNTVPYISTARIAIGALKNSLF